MQNLFNYVKQHALLFVLAIFALAGIASAGQFYDTYYIYHCIGYLSLLVGVLFVVSLFKGKDTPAKNE